MAARRGEEERGGAVGGATPRGHAPAFSAECEPGVTSTSTLNRGGMERSSLTRMQSPMSVAMLQCGMVGVNCTWTQLLVLSTSTFSGWRAEGQRSEDGVRGGRRSPEPRAVRAPPSGTLTRTTLSCSSVSGCSGSFRCRIISGSRTVTCERRAADLRRTRAVLARGHGPTPATRHKTHHRPQGRQCPPESCRRRAGRALREPAGSSNPASAAARYAAAAAR